MGTSPLRKEDERLLTGRGRFVEDLVFPGLLHAVFIRSPLAHARIVGLDRREALVSPGVVGVWAHSDLPEMARGIPTAALGIAIKPADWFPLARDRVRYVGEAMAAVVGEGRYEVADAAALARVDLEPLPVVASIEASLEAETAPLFEHWGDNVAGSLERRVGDPEAALGSAPHVFRERFYIQRHTGMPIEPRGVLAQFDAARGELTVWSSTQSPYSIRDVLSDCLGLVRSRVRVIAPDVGGGFGSKDAVYPEDLVIPALALRLNRPVKWIETRREHFQAAGHSREQAHEIALGLDAEGRIVALDDRFFVDGGAFMPFGMAHTANSVNHLTGPYRVPAYHILATNVATNKTPITPYRGAGRPEVCFVMDRILDVAATGMGIDPADLRLKNMIGPNEMPFETGLDYRDGIPIRLETGDYPRALKSGLETLDYQGLRSRQRQLWDQGRYLGIGISAYTEGTGSGPSESARVSVEPSGAVCVRVGVASQGQGHETSLAQICAEVLEVDLDLVQVLGGDTALLDFGFGTRASRVAVVAGNAVALAAAAVRDKAIQVAAEKLEVGPGDLTFADGRVHVRGAPEVGLDLAAIAAAAQRSRVGASGHGPGLAADGHFYPPTVTWASGVHLALVEVDAQTGACQVLRYLVVDDCGRPIHPVIVDGQIQGGAVQGLGAALGEELVYDGEGQLLAGSFLDYYLPRADDVPNIEIEHVDFLSPLNPLGIKGVGEGPTIPPMAAIAGAVEDALRPFGVRVRRVPLTSARIYQLIQEAASRGV